MISSDGRLLVRPRDPPGQLSVYMLPGDTKRETYRLMTFDKYPQGSAVDPWTFVKAGFYYRGYKDRVQCHGCGAQVQDWEVGDNPRDARWHEVTCKFDRFNPEENDPIGTIRDAQNNCGPQIPVDRQPPHARRVLWRSPEVTVLTPRPNPAGQLLTPVNHTGASGAAPNREALREMFPCDNPFSPHLTSLESRLQTFNDNQTRWSQVRIRATALQMAQAGLYYLGERDRAKCYYCNGGLQNWAFEDEPWFEHAKWFPLCEYVLQNKGPEYIERVTQRFSHLVRPRGAGSRQPLDIDRYGDAVIRTRRPRECVDKLPPIIDPGEERLKQQAQIEKKWEILM